MGSLWSQLLTHHCTTHIGDFCLHIHIKCRIYEIESLLLWRKRRICKECGAKKPRDVCKVYCGNGPCGYICWILVSVYVIPLFRLTRSSYPQDLVIDVHIEVSGLVMYVSQYHLALSVERDVKIHINLRLDEVSQVHSQDCSTQLQPWYCMFRNWSKFHFTHIKAYLTVSLGIRFHCHKTWKRVPIRVLQG